VLLEQSNRNLLIQLLRDWLFEKIIDCLGISVDWHFLNCFVEKLFYILKTVLVHLIDHTYVYNYEIKDTASFCHFSVHISCVINLLLNQLCINQVTLCVYTLVLSYFKSLNQELIVQNSFRITFSKFFKNQRLQLIQIVLLSCDLDD